MKYACLLLMIFLSITSKGQTKKALKTKEDKIVDMVASLPDVVKADAYCKKVSHGKRHLVTYVTDSPSPGKGIYYCLSVAEDNGSNYVTWYNFKVDAKTYEIKYADPETGREIPLAVWRKKKNYLGLK